MSLAIIHTTPPSSSPTGQEALECAFAFTNLEQDVTMIFVDDGVFQLLNGQDATVAGFKNHSKSYRALEFYDIENIFVCQESLQSRGLSKSELCVEVELFENKGLSSILEQYQHVVTF